MAKRKIPTEIPMEKITDPDQYGFYGIQLCEEQRVLRDAIWNPDIDVVLVNACAGSGKTLIATATANLLVQCGYFDHLTYVVWDIFPEIWHKRAKSILPHSIRHLSSVALIQIKLSMMIQW